LVDAQLLPHGRTQAGDRHLKFHETRDNLTIRGGAGLSVVRYFNDTDGPDRLGLHVSERAIRFLGAVHASVDIDEYDDRD